MKKTKKIISLIIAMLMLLSITGCHADEEDVVTAISDIVSSGQEMAESSNNKISDKFEYKMAPIYNIVDEKQEYKNWLSFAVEITSERFVLYDMVVKNNGNEIDGKVSIFKGYVCINDKKHVISPNYLYGEGGDEYDNCLYTILIKTNEDISPENVTISATAHFKSIGSGKNRDEILKTNSTISEITTRQEIIHGKTLFEMGGTYYVFDTDGFGGGYGDDMAYKSFTIHNLRPEDESLSMNNDNIGVVYSKTCEDYTIPSDCQLYCDSKPDEFDNVNTIELKLGLIKKNLSDEEYEKYSLGEMRLKYTDEKGSMILFIS